ncbi:MAG: DUF2723 domain-containing protein [Bacteroidetes bacterium]|nr:DUF2723 domain-containing protein [Bacteroidota bacterium]
MTHQMINRTLAVLVLIYATILYGLTVSPTVSFWDCGEFIATSYTLGVPHPPGSPIFLLLGRLFTSIPFVEDIGLRMNYMSVISSSLTIMLTYLIIVRLILYMKPNPDSWSWVDKVVSYGSALGGALVFSASESFWFNAVEAEVYALSMFFTAIVVWLVLEWADHSDEGHNERYLLIIAYMIGLAIGIHLLNMLTIFMVAVIIYFRKFTFSYSGFAKMVGISVLVFLSIYPGIIKGVPKLLEVNILIKIISLGALIFGIYWTHVNRYKIANLALLSVLLIIMGYASYAMIYIRSNAHPPINENDPSTPEQMLSYLNREQYGDSPFLERRWSSDPVHQRYYNMYDSDWDYFWNYQVHHMFNRYLGWNFIGRESDIQDSGVDWTKFWALPFIFGMIGIWYHFKEDRHRALAILALFFVTGYAIILYLNQTQPQPRERDYSYAGAFFAYAIWIGIGILGFIETIRKELLNSEKLQKIGVPVLVGLVLIFVPGRMLAINYPVNDRSHWYVPRDYARNILGGLEKDAIIFTNGDNDTFPLWYQQEVERYRTDVRVVNLSLLNTHWYILQLKNEEPRGAKKVKLPSRHRDADIVEIQPMRWFEEGREVVIPVDSSRVKASDLGSQPGLAVDSLMRFKINPTMSYRGIPLIRVQDFMIFDIIQANEWERPIYFAITVPEDNRIGLDNYLQLEGMVYRVVPSKGGNPFDRIYAEKMKKNLLENYAFTNLDMENVRYDDNIRKVVQNYRNLFQRLAFYYMDAGDTNSAVELTLAMREKMSETNVPFEDARGLINAAEVLSTRPEHETIAEEYNQMAEKLLREKISDPMGTDPVNLILLERLYTGQERWSEAATVVEQMLQMYPNQPSLKSRMNDYRTKAGLPPVP